MDWKEVGKKIISLGAPLLGTALLGPGVGTGIGALVASAFGSDPEKPEKLLQAITMDPDALVKLKKIELDHHLELEKLVIEREKMRLADIASARQREVDISKSTGSRDVNLYILAWSVILGFFALVGIMMFVDLPTSSSQAVGILFGGLVAGFTGVVQYFFGSSKSSRDKTALMAVTPSRKE